MEESSREPGGSTSTLPSGDRAVFLDSKLVSAATASLSVVVQKNKNGFHLPAVVVDCCRFWRRTTKSRRRRSCIFLTISSRSTLTVLLTRLLCDTLRFPSILIPIPNSLRAYHTLARCRDDYTRAYALLPIITCRSKQLCMPLLTPGVCHGPRAMKRRLMQIFLNGFRPCLGFRLSQFTTRRFFTLFFHINHIHV